MSASVLTKIALNQWPLVAVSADERLSAIAATTYPERGKDEG